MLLPEKDARTKYCPLLPSTGESPKQCLGSECMLWRFKSPDRRTREDYGYCGLAGKPMGAM